MRLETKAMQVAPNEEQGTIDLYQKFGWTLTSSQEIFSKDSHQEVRGGDVYNVTETTNYVKLTFQRDKDMEYYSEIVALENKYFSLNKPIYIKKKGLIILGIILAVLDLFAFGGSVILGIAVLIGAVVSIVFGVKNKKKAEETYAKECQEYRKATEAILHEVSAYV